MKTSDLKIIAETLDCHAAYVEDDIKNWRSESIRAGMAKTVKENRAVLARIKAVLVKREYAAKVRAAAKGVK